MITEYRVLLDLALLYHLTVVPRKTLYITKWGRN
jgi:hypothetical protein